jgi:UPF0755 protein
MFQNSTSTKKSFYIKLLIALIITIPILSFFTISTIDSKLGSAVGDGKTIYELTINSGDNAIRISKELEKSNMIKSSRYFLFLLRLAGNLTKLKLGIYVLNDGMSSKEVMNVLVSGKVKMITFTIPEGYHNRQIANLLVQKKLIEKKEDFFEIASKKEILEKYKIPAKTVEGYLFPETYSIPYNYNAEQIVNMLLKRFYALLEKIPESKDLDPSELHKRVIMASIIEREAKLKDEQPLMAGVFSKRLKINMPLESCATVQYLFEKPKKRLLERDLLIESEYNTYLRKGFPPGPISNPGFSALEAAFRPVESENLFFLVKPDGSHYFSKSHREHLEAKKKYIDVLYK